jgi:hypothetical protein
VDQDVRRIEAPTQSKNSARAACGVECLAQKPASVALCYGAARRLVAANFAGAPTPAPESRRSAAHAALEIGRAVPQVATAFQSI